MSEEIHSFEEQFDFCEREGETVAGFVQALIISSSRQGQLQWKSSTAISFHVPAKHRTGMPPNPTAI